MGPDPHEGPASDGGERRDFLTIDGMFCAACAASVEAVLNRQPGVDAASVNFAADAAVIDWSPAGEDRTRLLDAVRGLGYRARFVSDGGTTEEKTTDPARDLGLRLIVAVFFGMWSMLPSVALYIELVTDPAARLGLAIAAGILASPVILYSGLPFYRMGLATLRHRIAGVDALILLGVAGAVVLSAIALARGSPDVFFEVAIALVTLQLIARLLDLRVRRRARDAVVSLFDLAPARVRVVDAAGSERDVLLKEVQVGERIRIRPGERIAVDGDIVAGEAQVDRSLMSGESRPVLVAAPASVHAGERVLDGVLTLAVTAAVGKRRIDELGRQVRQMLAEKPAWQRAVDLVAGHFLWIATLAAAVGAALVLAGGGTSFEAAVRALTVFVIACPCALSLAAPLAGLVASGAAARSGIILRDLNAITAAAVPDRLFLDKTGTITEGAPQITAIHPVHGRRRAEVLELAATAERDSDHPVAEAIKAVNAARGRRTTDLPAGTGASRVVVGRGVVWTGGDAEIRVGQMAWLAQEGVVIPALAPTTATRVGVAYEAEFVGAIDLEDRLRPGMARTIEQLRARGIEPVILSGDAKAPVSRVADALGVAAYAGLTPEAKTDKIAEASSAGETVAFAGDGLNDAPALAAADLGIAVGRSTDAARTAAAVAFVEADATSLPRLFELTARTRRVINQNLTWAVAYNALAIPAALLGWVHPAIAAVAMALSSITIVLNGLRAGRGMRHAR
jgi:heavy metal translocating P-type ATPase